MTGLDISPHAIERFRERKDPGLGEDECRAAIADALGTRNAAKLIAFAGPADCRIRAADGMTCCLEARTVVTRFASD